MTEVYIVKARTRSPKILSFSEANEMVVAVFDGCLKPACLKCKSTLELHQPDLTTPERLLGICAVCHSWTMVEESKDGQRRLTALPHQA